MYVDVLKVNISVNTITFKSNNFVSSTLPLGLYVQYYAGDRNEQTQVVVS